jgi:hypothetical protein
MSRARSSPAPQSCRSNSERSYDQTQNVPTSVTPPGGSILSQLESPASRGFARHSRARAPREQLAKCNLEGCHSGPFSPPIHTLESGGGTPGTFLVGFLG